MTESVVKLLYRFILRDSYEPGGTVDIKFRDKAVEVSGQMYDNFRPLQHFEVQTTLPTRSKDTPIFQDQNRYSYHTFA